MKDCGGVTPNLKLYSKSPLLDIGLVSLVKGPGQDWTFCGRTCLVREHTCIWGVSLVSLISPDL